MEANTIIIICQTFTIGILAFCNYRYFYLNKAYKRFYKSTLESNDSLMEFCIKDIMNKATEREDYAEAQRCKNILNEIYKHRKENV